MQNPVSSPIDGSTQGTFPVIPEGDDVFRMLMGRLEPDLLLSEQELEQRYAGEDPAAQALRMERYKRALLHYNRDYEDYLLKQRQVVSSAVAAKRSALEEHDRVSDGFGLGTEPSLA
jgi:hypothetical protein